MNNGITGSCYENQTVLVKTSFLFRIHYTSDSSCTHQRDIIWTVWLNRPVSSKKQGCIFFILPPPRGQKCGLLVGRGKNMMIHKEKNVNLRRKWWKNGGKGEIFTVLGGKNIILEKKGAKISYFREIYTPGKKFSHLPHGYFRDEFHFRFL